MVVLLLCGVLIAVAWALRPGAGSDDFETGARRDENGQVSGDDVDGDSDDPGRSGSDTDLRDRFADAVNDPGDTTPITQPLSGFLVTESEIDDRWQPSDAAPTSGVAQYCPGSTPSSVSPVDRAAVVFTTPDGGGVLSNTVVDFGTAQAGATYVNDAYLSLRSCSDGAVPQGGLTITESPIPERDLDSFSFALGAGDGSATTGILHVARIRNLVVTVVTAVEGTDGNEEALDVFRTVLAKIRE